MMTENSQHYPSDRTDDWTYHETLCLRINPHEDQAVLKLLYILPGVFLRSVQSCLNVEKHNRNNSEGFCISTPCT